MWLTGTRTGGAHSARSVNRNPSDSISGLCAALGGSEQALWAPQRLGLGSHTRERCPGEDQPDKTERA